MIAVQVLVGAIVVAFGTMGLGWWFPVAWGAIAGLLWPSQRPARLAAVAALLGWGAWLVVLVIGGAPLGDVASRVGAVLRVNGPVLVLVTLLYPAVLALCAAAVTSRLRRIPASGRAADAPSR